MRKTESRQLAEDLAQFFDPERWMVWVEVPLGPGYDSPRADVLAVARSFNIRFLIYEVKVSRMDFLTDVNSGKYRQYFDHCTQLYFAAPSGVLKKEEIPEGCGLTSKSSKGWRVAKSARRREFEPSTELMVRLLLRGYEDHFVKYRDTENIRLEEAMSLRDAAHRHGIKLAGDLAAASDFLEEAERLRQEVSQFLGKECTSFDNAAHSLRAEIEALIRKRQFAEQAVELARIVMDLFDGHRLFIDPYPRRLREIADQIEQKIVR